MKIIDLLNKIAKGEEVPKKIKYNNEIWEYDKDLENYTRAGKPNTLFTLYYIHKILNDEIEIIEEPILTDKEREYLKAVIKSFEVKKIIKCGLNEDEEYINVEV